jgi:acyl carrier protein
MGKATKTDIEHEVVELIREFSTAPDLSVDLDMTFDQLSVSSLDVLQIIFRIEESHGISIDTGNFYKVKTVQDVVDYVAEAIM